MEQLLRSKPTASGEFTRFLAAALRDVGVQLRDCSLDSAAQGWLATADTQRRIRTAAERRLAILDQQIAVIHGFGAADPTVPALDEALRTVTLLGAERAQHASRLRDVLSEELGARVQAATLDENDVHHAAVLDARLAALRLLIDDGDQRVRDEGSAAADASDGAFADRECASQSVEVARHDLIVSLGRETEPDSVLSVALAELNDLLSMAESKHWDLASAVERRHTAYAQLAAVTEEFVRHAAVAPPRLPDHPGPFEVVNALRWLTEGDASCGDDAVIVYAGRDRSDELAPETISTLSQLSRHRWVIYAPKPPENSSVEHRDSPAADNDDLRAASAPNEVAIRRAPRRGIGSLRWRREPRRQADRV
jgi:hypothetical protein